MRNNESGEFELVVGNRQLLSGFFIVVLLFAVAFAMGYVVGQNSPRSSKLGNEVSAQTPSPVPDARPAPAAAVPTETPKSAEAASEPPAETAGDAQAESEAPQPTTRPARDILPAKSSPPAEAPVATAPAQLSPGTYWQVVAVAQHEAEVMAAALKEKGFAVVLSPGPKGLTRVLVGPYNNKEALGRAKTDIESSTGLHPFLFK
jgi:hypothetical protein